MIGLFSATISDYGVSVSKANRPQVFIVFDFEADGKVQQLTWYGSFFGKASPITLKQLLHAGLREDDFSRLEELCKGPSGNLLNVEKPLEISVQEKPHYEDLSRTVTEIAWFRDNDLKTGPRKIEEAAAREFFSGNRLEFNNELKKLAKDLGIDKIDVAVGDVGDIPF